MSVDFGSNSRSNHRRQKQIIMPKSIEDTDHLSESFQVQTVKGEKTYDIATDVTFSAGNERYMTVWGDDDYEDGPIQLRTFNMEYVVDYGWVP